MKYLFLLLACCWATVFSDSELQTFPLTKRAAEFEQELLDKGLSRHSLEDNNFSSRFTQICAVGTCIPNARTRAVATFDLANATRNPLDGNDFTLMDFATSDWYANVCAMTNKTCNNPPFPGTGIKVNHLDQSDCKILGRNQASWNLIDSNDARIGLQILYDSGDYSGCPNDLPRTVLHRFYCDSSSPTTRLLSAGVTQLGSCNFIMTFNSSLACPKVVFDPLPPPPTRLSNGWIFIIVLLVMSTLYVGGFSAINYRQGKRGRDLLPHPAFWAGLLQLVKDGFRYCGQLIRCKGRSSGYEDVQESYQYQTSSSFYSVGVPGSQNALEDIQDPSFTHHSSRPPHRGQPVSKPAIRNLHDSSDKNPLSDGSRSRSNSRAGGAASKNPWDQY